MKVARMVLALWMIFLLSACEGGSATDVRSSCTRSGRAGECTITVISLEGYYYRHEISNTNFWPGADNVEVSVSLTVEKGEVLFWMEDRQGNKQSVTVRPGEIAEIQGKAWLDTLNDKRSFYLYFELPGEGEDHRAENIQAQVRYDMP
jgi:hypothetical protein